MYNVLIGFIILLFTSTATYTSDSDPSLSPIPLDDIPSKNLTRPRVLLVDDFEDGSMQKDPEWWGFGDLAAAVVTNPSKPAFLGRKSVRFIGQASSWYVGGTGTYVARDLRRYNAIKMIVKGEGEGSGRLIIELFDDDNNNWKIEKNERMPSHTSFDDKFTYSFEIDWEGWKVVIIPLSYFRDANKGIGDDIWNPYQDQLSGGLIQFQLLAMSTQRQGRVDFQIDAIKFFKEKRRRGKQRSRYSVFF